MIAIKEEGDSPSEGWSNAPKKAAEVSSVVGDVMRAVRLYRKDTCPHIIG